MKPKYTAYLLRIEGSQEILVGEFSKLSPALIAAKCAAKERGISEWDWVVDKHVGCECINRRSSIAGFER